MITKKIPYIEILCKVILTLVIIFSLTVRSNFGTIRILDLFHVTSHKSWLTVCAAICVMVIIYLIKIELKRQNIRLIDHIKVNKHLPFLFIFGIVALLSYLNYIKGIKQTFCVVCGKPLPLSPHNSIIANLFRFYYFFTFIALLSIYFSLLSTKQYLKWLTVLTLGIIVTTFILIKNTSNDLINTIQANGHIQVAHSLKYLSLTEAIPLLFSLIFIFFITNLGKRKNVFLASTVFIFCFIFVLVKATRRQDFFFPFLLPLLLLFFSVCFCRQPINFKMSKSLLKVFFLSFSIIGLTLSIGLAYFIFHPNLLPRKVRWQFSHQKDLAREMNLAMSILTYHDVCHPRTLSGCVRKKQAQFFGTAFCGRNLVWTEAAVRWIINPLFGSGWGSMEPAHSVFWDVVSQLGFFGLVFYLAPFLLAYNSFITNKEKSIYHLFFLSFVILFFLKNCNTGTFIFYPYMYWSLTFLAKKC